MKGVLRSLLCVLWALMDVTDSIAATVIHGLESSCDLVLPSAALVVVTVMLLGGLLYVRKKMRKSLCSEKALHDQLKFFDALSEATPQPIYVRDSTGKFISGTRSYLEAVGAKAEDLYGKTVLQGPPKFGAATAMHDAYMQAMATNQTVRMLRATIMNGEERWIDHWVQPFHNAAGEMQGVICGWLDVTEQQRLIVELERVVSELEAARQLAEQANREKSRFLATMSHEIRTPLSAVIGTLELVQHQAEQGVFDKRGIQIAYSSATSVLDVIGDVLDISKIESGKLEFIAERMNFKALIESVASAFEGLAQEKGLTIVLESNDAAQQDVLMDTVRVRQMLFNLVSNAIKFTLVGQVKISAMGRYVGANLCIQLTVSDTGIGVPEHEQQRLFLPFAQGVNAASGSGLGLVITRSLCELMGGTLRMHSELNVGTTMVISLTAALAPQQDALSPLKARSSNSDTLQPTYALRVLVVEDYALHRQLLCQQLALLGHQATAAATGQQALALWRTTPFDVVITDYRMPSMSGIELTATIRQEESLQKRRPCLILGLTADAQREPIQQGLLAGMNDCAVKPLGLSMLKEKLAFLAQQQSAFSMPILQGSVGDMLVSPVANTGNPEFDTLLALTGGDREKAWLFAREILKSLDAARNHLPALDEGYDAASIAELAHQTLGVARMLAHPELVQACLSVQGAYQKNSLESSRGRESVQRLYLLLSELSLRYRQLFAVKPCAT